jgi:tetratricopeptide (TPR) repeat protein
MGLRKLLEISRLIAVASLTAVAIGSAPRVAPAEENRACPQNIVTSETPAPDKDQKALLIDEARACIHAGKPIQAISLFTQLIRIDPRDAFSYMNRATVRIAIGETEAGLDDFNTALSIQPDLVEAWYNRGNAALLHLHHFEGAIVDFNEAIRLKSDFAPAYCSRGLAKLALGQYDGALADYDSGIQRDPKQAFCHFNRANLYLISGEYQKAIVDFTAALGNKSSDAIALSRRGQAYEGLGQSEQALADYRAALELDPKLENAKEGISRLGK